MLESLFNKVACLPVKIAKVLKAPILKNICERLLLTFGCFYKSHIREKYHINFQLIRLEKITGTFVSRMYVQVNYRTNKWCLNFVWLIYINFLNFSVSPVYFSFYSKLYFHRIFNFSYRKNFSFGRKQSFAWTIVISLLFVFCYFTSK